MLTRLYPAPTCSALVLLICTTISFGLGSGAVRAELPRVEPVDLATIDLDDFTDSDLHTAGNYGQTVRPLPYYLAHLHQVANAVVSHGDLRGYININVWRSPGDNRPYNARIMESITSLAYFYTIDRPWNVYRGNPALRQRLEAALDFWVRIQHTDGRFSEYGEERWNLAATAFATKFMGETLRLLHAEDAPPLDTELLERVRMAQRRAIMFVLTSGEFDDQARRFTNQFGNVYAGASAYLDLWDDAAMSRALLGRGMALGKQFQSPAGYLYEAHGPDWGYNFGTHMSNVLMAWHYQRGTRMGDWLVDEMKLFIDWVSYNALLEPGSDYFVLNRAIETRQQRSGFTHPDIPMADVVPLARAFMATDEQAAEAHRTTRDRLASRWPDILPLQVDDFAGFTPYGLLHRNHEVWYPSADQREAARAELPYLARYRFVHQRSDRNNGLTHTYIRRPTYYAALNTGNRVTRAQRLGIGIIWHPEMGTVFQSQSRSDEHTYGTRAASDTATYEAEEIETRMRLGSTPVFPRPGVRDFGEIRADFTVVYPLNGSGRKTITFADDAMTVQVEHRGDFAEQLPLVVGRSDNLELNENRVTLRRGDAAFVIEFKTPVTLTTDDTSSQIPNRQITTVTANAANRLTYTMRFAE